MRTFENFPETSVCPICGTNDNKECFLVPIDGTDEGNICQAAPAHVSCLDKLEFRYNKAHGIIYGWVKQ